ncbi:hypothetical protein [Limnoglobus roseus]|uniref:hypothetical protein n=1 Tax=Limnoglobus roseus TaxID=2598579 RepID=UPI0011EAA9DA|nr:hypothetical protein [Limnoglobus roseus]
MSASQGRTPGTAVAGGITTAVSFTGMVGSAFGVSWLNAAVTPITTTAVPNPSSFGIAVRMAGRTP